MTRQQLANLFDPPPDTWGLRGDPFLWDELRQAFSNEEALWLPAEFHKRLTARIGALVGTNLLAGEDVFIERFDAGGMSSGRVSSAFWLEEAIPLLLARYQAMQHSNISERP